MSILDFLFPKYCVNCKKIGSYVCTNCFTGLKFIDIGLCVICDRPSIDGLTHPRCTGKYAIDGVFSSITYSKIAKKLVYRFKYKPYISDLTSILSDLLYEGIIQNESFAHILPQVSLITSIPLSKEKLRARGYNQAELLAKTL